MEEIIRCPRRECNHPINQHLSDEAASLARVGPRRCTGQGCNCHVDPNTIALATVQTALFGGLTQPPAAPKSVRRQPDGSWE